MPKTVDKKNNKQWTYTGIIQMRNKEKYVEENMVIFLFSLAISCCFYWIQKCYLCGDFG